MQITKETNIKSRLIIAVFFAATLIFIGGCDSHPDSANAPPLKSPVTFLHYFSDSLSGGVAELTADFNTSNSGHELRSVSLDHESFKSGIHDTLKMGNPPDLYSYWAGARTAAIVDQLMPIDEVWQQAGMDSRFDPQIVESAVTYHGKKYLLPISQHFIAFFYNKRVFEQHRIRPSANWGDLMQACTILRSAGITPIALGARDKWPAQFWFDYILLRSEPLAFRTRLVQGHERYDDPRVLAVFSRVPNKAVEFDSYTDIQRRIRQEILRSQHFTFAFDLSTPPAIATLGLDAFAEFLAFPEVYPDIARNFAEKASAYYASTALSR